MEQIRPRLGRPGLVDHDHALRHRALGWIQIGVASATVVSMALIFAFRSGFHPRILVFPTVNLLGLAVQRILWRKGNDVLAGHILCSSLLLGTAFGLGINGIAAPVVLSPAVCGFAAGSLLGSRAGSVYLALGLGLIGATWLAQSAEWIAPPPAPPAVWLRVLLVLDFVAVQMLVFLLLGLRSTRRIREKEAESLEAALQALRAQHAELESEVRQRTADLERANLELADFGRVVSHDLRGPLRAIRGYLDIVRTESGPQASAPAYGRLRRSAEEVERILSEAARRTSNGVAP
jgi:signal transduction histidine kinase